MRRRVRDARVATFATLTEDGRAHLVPITFAVSEDVLFSAVDAKPKTSRQLKRLANIERDDRVTVLVDRYDDDWSELFWVRLEGRARVVREGAEFDRAIEALTDKYAQYREEPPAGPMIVVDVSRWSGWTASAEEAGP